MTTSEGPPQPSIRLLTLRVFAGQASSNRVLVRASLQNIPGVEIVVGDPCSQRVWLFTDGRVDVETLSHALACWAFRVEAPEECAVTLV